MKEIQADYTKRTEEIDIEYEVEIPYSDDSTDGSFECFLNDYEDTLVKIEQFTNNADKFDYAIAVTSGIISGIIDVLFVGEWNFESAKARSNEEINRKVISFAKKHPDYNLYCEKTLENLKKKPPKAPGQRRICKDPERLETAIGFLEYRYHLPGDGAYKGRQDILAKTHRLDDFCHHPTVVGLICCILVQFTKKTIYFNSDGELIKIPIEIDEEGDLVGNNLGTKVFCGLINWVINVAKLQKGHLMSDIATPAGIPGSFLSIITEIASLPCFKDAEFLKKMRNLYSRGIGTGKNQVNLKAFNKLFEGASSKMDQRTELAIKKELERQAVPVIINEAIVRGAYCLRRFIMQAKEKNNIDEFDWKAIIPFNNRTIVRMMTISVGTMEAIDVADAAIRATAKSGGNPVVFAEQMVLRVNFVGIGRLVIACSADIAMGIKRERYVLAATTGEIAITANVVENNISSISKRIGNTSYLLENNDKLLEDNRKQVNKMKKVKF